MLLIIIKNLILVACIYGSYKLARRFFDDNQKILRIIATFVISVVLFGIVSSILELIMPSVNVDKQLQNEEVFVALKSKYPLEYQTIVDKVTLESESNDLNKDEVVLVAEDQLAPLALKLATDASDDARYAFIKSYTTSISSLKNKGGTLCYDLMRDQNAITKDQVKTINDTFNQSGVSQAVLKIINDNRVGKSIVSQRDMDKMQEKIFKQLSSKHGKDIQLLTNPTKATSVEKKQRFCLIVIDMFELMNDPNDKVKKAVLRHSIQNIATGATSIKSEGSTQAAAPASISEPQMAAPAF